MNDFLENNWERLTSLWRRPEEGELSQGKKILQQQFEIRQAMHGLSSHRYDVDNAWRKIQPKRAKMDVVGFVNMQPYLYWVFLWFMSLPVWSRRKNCTC